MDFNQYKIGDKIWFSKECFLIVGLYTNGQIVNYGLLSLKENTIGYIDDSIQGLLESYYYCE